MLPLRRPTIYSATYAVLPEDRPAIWTLAEHRRLEEMRRRFGVTRDLLTDAETRYLCFVCWLVAKGKVRRG